MKRVARAMAALLLAACGGRTPLGVGDATVSGGRTDAGAPVDLGAAVDGPPDPCASAWTVVELGSWGGGAPSIAIDPEGRAHVAYTTGEGAGVVELATRRDDGAWGTEPAGVEGQNPSIAIGADGEGHLAVGAGDEIVQLSSPDWSRQSVSASRSEGGNPLAIGADGALRIAFHHDLTDDVRFATRGGGGWELVAIEHARDPRGSAGDDLDLALAADAAHLVYASLLPGNDFLTEIRHATDVGGSWRVETVASEGGRPAIAVSPDGTVHVIYAGALATGLYHATSRGEGWSVETVDIDAGRAPCVALRADGALHIAYGAPSALRSAVQVPEGWAIREVTRVQIVAHCAMGFDARGRQHIVFADETEGGNARGTVRHAARRCDDPSD